MKMKRSFTYLILLALFAGLLAACGEEPTPIPRTGTNTTTGSNASGSGASGNAAGIIKDSVGAAVGVKDYQSTIDLTYTGTGAGTLSMDVVLRGSLGATDEGPAALPQFKGTITKSTLPTVPAGTVAALGKTTFLYDPTNKVVLKGGASAASSEVYNLFLGSQSKAATLFSSDLATPTLVGDEKVGSYNTSRLDFTPKANVTSTFGKGAKGSVWVDKDTKLPVQLDYSEEGGGQKWTVSNLQVNKGVDDAKLTYTPPTDARVVDSGQFGQTRQVANLDEAKTTAGYALATVSYLPADLPKNPTAVAVQTTPVGNIITAEYSVKTTAPIVTPFPGAKSTAPAQSQKGVTIRALKASVNLPSNLPSGVAITDVTIGGQKGTLAALNETTAILTFAKDGVFYTISSSGYGKDEVTKVGEGLK